MKLSQSKTSNVEDETPKQLCGPICFLRLCLGLVTVNPLNMCKLKRLNFEHDTMLIIGRCLIGHIAKPIFVIHFGKKIYNLCL